MSQGIAAADPIAIIVGSSSYSHCPAKVMSGRQFLEEMMAHLSSRPRLGAAQSSPVLIETLEDRRLLSGGPTIIGQQLVGPVKAVNGVVLTFSEALDPVTAGDVKDYSIGRPVPQSNSNNGFLDGFSPFLRRAAKGVHAGKVRFVTAAYDDSTHSVTLTPAFAFKAEKFFKGLKINGKGAHFVQDTQGNPLDGNGDGQGGDNAVLIFFNRRGKNVTYSDASGNRVTLNLKGPGRLVVFLRRGNQPSPMVFLDGTKAGRSILTGTVSGGGTTIIPEVSGASTAQVDLLNNPAFQIDTVRP